MKVTQGAKREDHRDYPIAVFNINSIQRHIP